MGFPLVYLLINCISMWISLGNIFSKHVNCTKRLLVIRALHQCGHFRWLVCLFNFTCRSTINLPLSKSGLYFTPRVPLGKWCAVTLDQVSRSKFKLITIVYVWNTCLDHVFFFPFFSYTSHKLCLWENPVLDHNSSPLVPVFLSTVELPLGKGFVVTLNELSRSLPTYVKSSPGSFSSVDLSCLVLHQYSSC